MANNKPLPITIIEFIPALFLIGLFMLLPYRFTLWFSRLVGRIAFRFAEEARNDALYGLSLAFPDWDKEKIRAMAIRSFEHMVMYFVEAFVFPIRFSSKRIEKKLVRVVNYEVVEKILAEGKGLIALAAHLGNPEIPGMITGIKGHPVYGVNRRMDNPLFQWMAKTAREAKGIIIVPRDKALRMIFDALRTNNPVAFLIDQNWAAGGVFVPFFGKLAATAKGPVQFAMKTGAKLLVTYDLRNPDGTHTATFGDIVELEIKENDEETIRYTTAKYTKIFEDLIRQHPEQWMWAHGRWSTRPPEEIKGK
ncbi:MAG: lysophospholipid acyltransferase family protein [Spirochaetota bacterium]